MRKTLKRNLSYDDRNHLSYVSLYCDGEDGRRVRRTRTYPTMEQAEQVIAEHRRAQRRLQEVEEAMATQNQPGSILPGRTMQTAVPVSGGQSAPVASETELLRRKLAEANAEIRRYETRLFAYERAMLDLRRENAELQALCEQARAGETLPEPTPQPTGPVLEKPELPVIHFPAPARDAGVAQGPLTGEIETLLDTGTPEWEPKTKLDHLSVDIISQLEQLMGT